MISSRNSRGRSQRGSQKLPSHAAIPPKLRVASSFGSTTTETTCAISEYSDAQYDGSPSYHQISEEGDNEVKHNDQVEEEDDDDDMYTFIGDDMSFVGITAWDDSSSSESLLSGPVGCDATQAQVQQSALIDETDGAVCFGWIRHKTTELWRDKVKIFSDNRKLYPSWTKDICKEVLGLLEQEGVVRFLVCRSDKANRDKIHANQGCTGKWRTATSEQILAKTKQRFTDDRKPPPPPRVSPIGPKSRRGRPPKILIPSICLAHQSPRESGSPRTRPYPKNDVKRVAKSDEPNRLTGLRQLAQGIETLPNNGNRTDATFDIVPTAASQVHPDLTIPSLDQSSFNNESVQTNSENFNSFIGPAFCSERDLWYPIESKNVCFDWNNHHGTDRWNEVIGEMAGNTNEYPTWNDTICDRVKERLSQEGIHFFCTFLDSNGQICMTILHGMWYSASDDEIMERTKQKFLCCRKGLEDAAMVVAQCLGPPPAGRANGNDPPPKHSEDNEFHSSPSENNDMSGQGSSDFFAWEDHSYQCQNAFSVIPMEYVSKFSDSINVNELVNVKTQSEAFHASNCSRRTSQEVIDAVASFEENGGLPTNVESQLPDPVFIECSPEEDSYTLDCDPHKSFVDEIKNQLDLNGADEVRGHANPMATADLEKLQIIDMDERRQSLTLCSVLVNQRQPDGPEFPDITKTQLQKDSTRIEEAVTQKLVITPQRSALQSLRKGIELAPLDEPVTVQAELLPGAFRVQGSSYLQRDYEIIEPPYAPNTHIMALRNFGDAYVVSNTLAAVSLVNDEETSVALDIVPLSDICLSIPDQLKPLFSEMAEGEAYTIITEKLTTSKWRPVLTTLDAHDFGCLIANVKMDFDRPRVAELLASRMTFKHGAQGFTCQHAALAIQNTRFKGIMAERMLPYCVDISSHISLVKRELQDWDVSLLLLSLCRRLQSADALCAARDDQKPRRSIRHRLVAPLKFIHKSLRRRTTTTTQQ